MNSRIVISSTITRLRFPLTLLVVMIHTNLAASFYARGVEYHIISDTAKFIVQLFSNTLGQLAVPIFFVISGYLFAAKVNSCNDWLLELKKRTRTILLPYIVWNTLGLLMVLVTKLPVLSNFFPNVIEDPLTLGVALKGYWANSYGIDVEKATLVAPWDMPLWYIRDLVVMFILTLVILWLHDRFGLLWIVLSMAIYMIIPSSLLIPGISGTSLLFYTLGVYVLKDNWGGHIVGVTHRKCWILMGLFLMMTVYANVETNIYFAKAYRLVGALLLFMIFANNRKDDDKLSPATLFFASSSFFLYAAHTLYNGIITKIMIVLLKIPQEVGFGYTMIIYWGSVILTAIIALFFYNLVKRNRFLSLLLTGGR